jgi:glycosyltransferase involved in cell wall biosynthesis
MLLSVIIATYNRSEVLKQNLDCFKQQTDKNFEVVVGIDGSTDNTKEMLANYQPDFEIRWVDSGQILFS